MAKIVIIAGNARSLIANRAHLIATWKDKGHKVIALVPEYDATKDLDSLGIKYHLIPLFRTSINPFKDAFFIVHLIQLLKQIKPDILFTYTIKPVIYGAIAAHFAKVPNVFPMITGLGYIYAGSTLKQNILKRVTNFLYKIALKKSKKVFFQNDDDLNLFLQKSLLPQKKAVKINGSGVDIDKYYYTLPPKDRITFLLVSRLLYYKGIVEFVEAAKLIKIKYPNVQFQILGPYDNNPDAISERDMENWEKEGVVEYLGKTNDVRSYIAQSSVFVLPSYYREGTPRSILEAMSMGKPIITTNAPGCKETVENGVNGFLVPVKDIDALTNAMTKFIINGILIEKMGLNSRELAIQKYDVHKVNDIIIKEMKLNEFSEFGY